MKGKAGVRMIARICVLLLILCICAVFFVKHFNFKEYSADDMQAFLDDMCKKLDVPAMSAAVWDHDREIYLNHSDGGEIVDEHSLYELASTTKAFTALGILRLNDSGLLSFDDPVQKYIPEFNPTYKGSEVEITIGQLLNHSSGIPWYALDLIPEEEYNPGGLKKSLSRLFDVELSFEPGSRFDYSTVNYDFLALAAETVTGMGYEEYIKTTVLDEVGMTGSYFRSAAVEEGVTQGNRTAFLSSRPYNAPVYYGNTAAGYLISNTGDLMKWMKQVDTLFDFEDYSVSDQNGYFAGWWIEDDRVLHGGNNPNYSSYVFVNRESPTGVFVLSSKAGMSAWYAADGLYRMLEGETVGKGLWIDCGYSDLEDALFLIVPLLLLYVLLWIPADSKGRAIVRLASGAVILIGVPLLLCVLPVGLRFGVVWLPGSFLFLFGFILTFAVYLIVRSAVFFHKNKKATSA
ncbi:MAG: beta-lactamase family protein [Clostridiales bacterium]|nr:beta-lactamase family protein [Clostridiales bacterium]